MFSQLQTHTRSPPIHLPWGSKRHFRLSTTWTPALCPQTGSICNLRHPVSRFHLQNASSIWPAAHFSSPLLSPPIAVTWDMQQPLHRHPHFHRDLHPHCLVRPGARVSLWKRESRYDLGSNPYEAKSLPGGKTPRGEALLLLWLHPTLCCSHSILCCSLNPSDAPPTFALAVPLLWDTFLQISTQFASFPKIGFSVNPPLIAHHDPTPVQNHLSCSTFSCASNPLNFEST